MQFFKARFRAARLITIMIVQQRIRDETIAAALRPYGFSPSAAACEKIRIYISLLLRWNQKISLTALTTVPEILQVHFGESIFATSSVPMRGSRLADVGTGAGFPGLPMIIAQPNLQLLLIEPNTKKCAFLSEIIRALDLDVEIARGRMESALAGRIELDYITARAVGNWDEILGAGNHLSRAGKLILWVGELAVADLTSRGRKCWSWKDPIKIPGTLKRFILVGEKP